MDDFDEVIEDKAVEAWLNGDEETADLLFDYSGKPLVGHLCLNCGQEFNGREERKFCTGTCAAEYRIRYLSPEDAKARKDAANLKHRYGLTPEELADMDVAQLNSCAICGDKMGDGRRRHIDHDHKTGNVRALLCAGCNTSLGHIERAGIEKFAAYLEKHKTKED